MVPLPRYLTKACCEDSEHVPNRNEEGFLVSILSGLGRIKKCIRDFLFSNGVRNLNMVGPKSTDEALQVKLHDLWQADPVHRPRAATRTFRSGYGRWLRKWQPEQEEEEGTLGPRQKSPILSGGHGLRPRATHDHMEGGPCFSRGYQSRPPGSPECGLKGKRWGNQPA
jgi:hypothetical protein